MANQLNENLKVLFERMEEFVSTKTVVGEPIVLGSVTLLPLVEVSVGVGAGGSDKNGADSGAGGLGAKITPSAVIAVTEHGVQLINIKNQDAVSKLIDMAPGVVNKLNFGSFGKKKESPAEEVRFEEQVVVEE